MVEGSTASNSVSDENSKSPSQNMDINNDEAQKTIGLDVNLPEKYMDVQKRFKKVLNKL